MISGSDSEFLLGSQSLNLTNKLFVLKYDDDNLTLDLSRTFDYPQEIWVLASNLSDLSSIAIGSKSTLDLCTYSDVLNITHSFPTSSRITSIAWDEHLYCTTAFDLLNIDIATQTSTSKLNLQNISICRIDPHHKFLTAVGYSSSFIIYDSRDSSNRYAISPAHGGQILDIDFNPNNPYHLVSSGKDFAVKFWDIRKQGCLKTVKEHSHYVWQVKFNAFHDQLLISASSDNTVALHRVVSASSAPVDESFFEKENDLLILKVDSFDDSVYACTWINGEAWHFASVSYDGKVVISAVPSEEKYKILL